MGGGPKYYMLIQQYTAKIQYVYLSTYCFKFKVNTFSVHLAITLEALLWCKMADKSLFLDFKKI